MRTLGADDSEQPSAETVMAAQHGDRKALDRLVAGYLPLLYNIVGRAMNGHADVDDVVQETLLRAVRGLPELRDPFAFRSWLVAIAIRQVRGFYSAQAMSGPGPDTAERASQDSDFADLTILQLGLSGQRRETAEATRWLDEDDRDLLSLWWQETAGRLERREVAEALGLPARHAAVRIARMKEQLATARIVVRALHEVPPCDDLAVVTANWDHHPSPLWRKRVARHARNCARCGAQQEAMVPAERLLAGLPLLPVPVLLGRHLLAHGARLLRHRLPAARHARALGKTGAYLQPKVIAASLAVVTCATGGTFAAVHMHADAATTIAMTTPSARPAVARPAALAPVPGPQATVRQTVRPQVTVRPARTRPPATTAPPAPATTPVASGPKKGVATWSFGAAQQALAASGASWYYNWGASPSGVSSPAGVSYVPQIWGAANVTSATLAQVKAEGKVLLGFNEPDLSSQSNLSVSQALSLWPQLESTGMTLGSPAVAAGGDVAGGWLDQFMSGAAARGYRVDFICLHWYGSDFDPTGAVSQLRSYVEAVYNRYHKPIWVTEFGLANFGNGTFPTGAQQAAFLTGATTMLDQLPYVQRYAWFALSADGHDGTLGLFNSDGTATETGRAFEAAAGG